LLFYKYTLDCNREYVYELDMKINHQNKKDVLHTANAFLLYFIFNSSLPKLDCKFCQGTASSSGAENYLPAKLATKYSLFKRAMLSNEMPLGHSSAQAPVLVQLPNPSSSILVTMLMARS
jgi:hypothetical protein